MQYINITNSGVKASLCSKREEESCDQPAIECGSQPTNRLYTEGEGERARGEQGYVVERKSNPPPDDANIKLVEPEYCLLRALTLLGLLLAA